MNLSNQVVVITGASDGLGKALALRLMKEQVKLALLARSEDKLKLLQEEIVSQGGQAEYVVCDITQVEQIQNAVSQVKEQFGTIDILVNNAGIWTAGTLEQHSVEKIKQLFTTNTLGTIFTTKEVLPLMKEHKSGQILNVISVAGIEEVASYGLVYVATKHALQGFTDTLKQELQGSAIKVMGFYPGGMATNIFQAAGISAVDSNQMMKVEDIAEILTFVLKQPKDVVIDHFEVRKFM
ncbi:MAG TPA: SDR family oxidoreductase [Candidatus Woesebacteria bacterium]|nr:SDR family oxidoreductase [Candidatus Woesebacteria bacterium]